MPIRANTYQQQVCSIFVIYLIVNLSRPSSLINRRNECKIDELFSASRYNTCKSGHFFFAQKFWQILRTSGLTSVVVLKISKILTLCNLLPLEFSERRRIVTTRLLFARTLYFLCLHVAGREGIFETVPKEKNPMFNLVRFEKSSTHDFFVNPRYTHTHTHSHKGVFYCRVPYTSVRLLQP